jgi:hypothetical protein
VAKLVILLLFIFCPVCNLLAQKQLHPEALSKFIPSKLAGYYEEGDLQGSQKAIGNLSYTVCERRFTKGKQKIKILLFDYKDAPIMYKQAMKSGKNIQNIESDSLIARNIVALNYVGWELYNSKAASSQIFLGIADRFFLMLSAEHVDLISLEQILPNFKFESFTEQISFGY